MKSMKIMMEKTGQPLCPRETRVVLPLPRPLHLGKQYSSVAKSRKRMNSLDTRTQDAFTSFMFFMVKAVASFRDVSSQHGIRLSGFVDTSTTRLCVYGVSNFVA